MILTKPYIIEIDEIDRESILRKIESAARNCYQSKMSDDLEGASKFVRGLVKSGRMAPVELGGMINVKIRTSRSVLTELTRHRLTSFCLSGDTEVKGFSDRRWTIEQLYNYKNSSYAKGKLKQIKLRSVNEETHTIVPNNIVDIYYNGEKEVYELLLESGRKIKCTANHRIFTPEGYKKLEELKEGEYVYSNGIPCLDNPDWLYQNYVVLQRSSKEIAEELGCRQQRVINQLTKYKIKRPYDSRFKNPTNLHLLEDQGWLYHNYIELNRQRKDIAAEIGCCESVLNRAFRKWGIRKEKGKYPNRQPGRGRGWANYSEESKARIIAAHSGPNSNWWKEDRDSLKISGGYSEAHSKIGKQRKNGICAFCGRAWEEEYRLEIHHMDKNPKNNKEENLKLLCPKCHHLYHHTWALGVFPDKIVSITPVGVEKVYDIEMEAPYHNFVANGIVVHNCVESQRYVNPTQNKFGIEFIIPYNITVTEPEITDGYYEIGMVPIKGPAGQMGVGLQIATASLKDGKLGITRQVRCKETTGLFLQSLAASEQSYIGLIQMGYKPQDAREVLPNATACTITMGANLREWKHIFNLRVFGTTGKPYPPCKEIMSLVYEKFHAVLPEIFPDEIPADEPDKTSEEKKIESGKKSILLGADGRGL